MGSRVLVVDRDEAITTALDRYFSSMGFEVDAANGVSAGEALIASARHDVAVIDLDLSSTRHAGLCLLSLARRTWPDACRILLTANSAPDVAAVARSRGAHLVLMKPRSPHELAQTISRFLPI